MVLGATEAVVAVPFVDSALRESPGPDSLIAAVAVAACTGIALACAGGVRDGSRALRPAPPARPGT
ncbi:hypothetical protein [Streptomyces sp. NPDC088755]|uniref:hypothetical protein n=1 Tax=Streptomyces sp. NPDC088755 TaxID=3365888 RepID=UPI0038198AEE